MAQIVLGAAGAVIGSYFGAPQLGWAIGSALGGALFPGQLPDQVGPRLSDLKVQTSTYGTMIPIIYGTVRVAGNVIWSTDLQPHDTTTESGGKGGPSQSTTTTSYTVSCAVSLGANEIIGVSQIYADSTLIYDATSGNSGPVQIDGLQFKVYTGSETQLPDPTIESYLGAGNVPGYRGQAYVVFTDFPLEKFGNRMPNFSFVVVQNGAYTPTENLYDFSADTFGASFVYNPLLDEVWMAGYDAGGEFGLTRVRASDGVLIGRIITPANNFGASQYNPIYQQVYVTTSSGQQIIEAGTGAFLSSETWSSTSVSLGVSPYSGEVWDTRPGPLLKRFDPLIGTVLESYTVPSLAFSFAWSPDGAGWYISDYFDSGVQGGANTITLTQFRSGIGLERQYVISTSHRPHYAGGYQYNNHQYDGDRNSIWIKLAGASDTEGGLIEFSLDSLEKVNEYSIPKAQIASGIMDAVYDPFRKVFWYSAQDAQTLVGINTRDGSVYDSIDLGVDLGFYGIYTVRTGSNGDIWVGDNGFGFLARIGLPRLQSSPIFLSDVVSDLSVMAGLTTGDINVAALTDLVDGYVITRQAPIRAEMEQLQNAYSFDAVESDGVNKFVKRGGASAVTITSDDLAAHHYGDKVPEILSTTRAQEVELPSALNVLYLNAAANYQTNTQQSKRLIGASGEAVTAELPLVLSDDHAKQIADRSIFNAWTTRTSHKYQTTNKYAKYEPTDVMTVNGYVLRVTKKDEGQGLIKWEGVAEIAALYTQAGLGVAANSTDQTIEAIRYTNLELLDIPMLRDQDDDAGFYYAASGYLSNWPGAVLYKSSDDGATYSESGSIDTAASIGTATTALGNFSGGNTFDEANTVTVALTGAATLSSTTELAVLNGANAALLGDEIIEYKTATLNANGTYTLSGLLRGRRGTEWAMTTHAIGDRFVALSTVTLNRLAASSSEISLARKYKAVTLGLTLAGTNAETFTNNAVALECYAPVLLGGGRDASGNITINFTPRTRKGGEWRDYVDATASEAVVSYDVEIWNSTFTTLKRTFAALSSATTPYSSANQTTDFGGNQATVYVRVYQNSATVGRGYVLQGTV